MDNDELRQFLFYKTNRMFRALAALKNESAEGFNSSPHSTYVARQTATFNKQYPNMYPTALQTNTGSVPSQILANSRGALAAWDPNTRQASMRDIELDKYATSVDLNMNLESESNLCKTTPIDSLMNTQNPNKEIRCGWIYKAGTPGNQPAVSEGALGSRSGPVNFVPTPQGAWYWNLDDAKKQILADRCAAMTNCKDVGTPGFQGCAYSTSRGIGVPVDAKGALLYPQDPKLTALASSLVRSATACPAPPPPNSPQAELQRSRDLCAPMANGQLSRDCMLQQITAAGCKQDGQLYQSLVNDALPNNYAAGLANMVSFKKYQELATPPILDSIIRQGGTSTQVALDNFKSLATASQKVENTAVSFAARDLCLKRGLMDQFDFCDELSGSSRAPFALDCLQKAFLRGGGQQAGSEYPTTQNVSRWNALGTWKAVLDTINRLKGEMTSKDEKVQREALTKFLGVRREAYALNQIGVIPGIEVYWFNRGNNTFIGRRIRGGGSAEFPQISTRGIVEGTGLADNVEYLAMVNLRPPSKQQIRLRLETDDGILYSKNVQNDTRATRGKFFDTQDTFGANWDQAPTRYDQKTCWTLEANGPNYISGWWQETGGMARSQIFYAPCNSTAFQRIPSEWMTLTQEPDAPILSWQGTEYGFIERRMPTFFELTLSGATTAQVKLPAYPFSTVLGFTKTASAQIRRNIAANAWRTLTLSFIPGANFNDQRVLLSFGALKISLAGKSVLFEYTSATINSRKLCPNVLITDGKTPHYIYVNLRSDFESTFPNRITFAVARNQQWLSGAITRADGNNNVGAFTTTNNVPLFNTTDAAQLILGDPNRVMSAEAQVGFVRLFDYELDDQDIMRDIKNGWQMMYY
jgi:hypothetical protein